MSRPPASHTTRIKVYYFDTDAGNVVHNVAYLRMVEVARTELADAMGWTLEEMGRTGLVPVVARTEIDYLKPARLGDTLRIEGRVTKLEKIRFHLEFQLFRDADGVLLARSHQTMVTVNLATGRPQPVPEAWTAAYPELVGVRE
ncbi:MAG: thioesterase family protein [Verrucomicrobium sp.]|nr:thioesterase family protein [Verrucomicrobium sp.]